MLRRVPEGEAKQEEAAKAAEMLQGETEQRAAEVEQEEERRSAAAERAALGARTWAEAECVAMAAALVALANGASTGGSRVKVRLGVSLLLVPKATGFTPSDKAELKTALGAWTSNVSAAQAAYGHINTWNTTLITDMSYLFCGWGESWNNGDSMSSLGCGSAYQSFNDDIGSWQTGAVTTMFNMFTHAWAFNQDISAWQTGAVTTMAYMFHQARSFNQDISPWDIGAVTTMASMFRNADSMNQQLCWNVSGVLFDSYTFWNSPGVSFDGCQPTPAPTGPTMPPTFTPTTMTPSPTLAPTRTPVVQVRLGLSGIDCDDFDQTVYDEACDAVLSNSTFEDATCALYADSTGVTLTSEVRVALAFIASTYADSSGDHSVHSHVMATLEAAVSDGSFTTAIQTAAARRRLAEPELRGARRLSMASATADSVEVATFSPTPSPTQVPTSLPSPAPSVPPTPAPSADGSRYAVDDGGHTTDDGGATVDDGNHTADDGEGRRLGNWANAGYPDSLCQSTSDCEYAGCYDVSCTDDVNWDDAGSAARCVNGTWYYACMGGWADDDDYGSLRLLPQLCVVWNATLGLHQLPFPPNAVADDIHPDGFAAADGLRLRLYGRAQHYRWLHHLG